MVAISKLAFGLSAIAGSLAAPAEVAERKVEERGPPNFILDENHPLMLARRNFTMALAKKSNTNYNQDYTTGGNIQYSPGTNQFSLTYSVSQDFVVGVGWNPGGTAPITHTGSFSVTSGLGSLSVYGWSTNPLVEYYVMDCNVGISTGGSQKGTVTSDGATYAIWEHQQVNQPSIQGTSTFNQYISIRQGCTTSGTISVENHFNAWASHGMNLGSLNFQVIAVESWSGSGNAKQSITNTGSSSPPPPPPPPPPASSTHNSPPPSQTSSSSPPPPPPSSGGSCSAQWGQCGGLGWSGPQCCNSGFTCKEQNPYYSQCL